MSSRVWRGGLVGSLLSQTPREGTMGLCSENLSFVKLSRDITAAG